MRLKHVTGLLCAAAMSLVLASGARAQDKVVKIGAILPMSGGTASIGAHAKAALEVATDIINNAHPELGNLPLAKNAGLAGPSAAPRSRSCSRTTRATRRQARTRRCV
ncbi:hypothetical protein ACVWW5_005143 [Bradyrhizobium sp. LM3.4]